MSQESLKKIEIDSIDVEPGFNVRTFSEGSTEKLRELGQNIAGSGLRNPLILEAGEDGRFILRAGHRRFAAIKLYNEAHQDGTAIFKVPAVVHKKMTAEERLNTMGADIYSEPLSPLDFAEFFKRLVTTTGLSQSEAARKYGISVAYAGDLLKLADAPEAVKEAVREEVISGTLATELVKEEGAEGAVKLIEAAKEAVKAEEEAAEETPEEESEGEGKPAKAAHKPKPKTKPTKGAKTGRNTKRTITKGTLNKLRGGSDKPEVKSAATPKVLMDRFLDLSDMLYARYRKGEDIKDQVTDIGFLIREAAMAGYLPARMLSGITKDTPDESF